MVIFLVKMQDMQQSYKLSSVCNPLISVITICTPVQILHTHPQASLCKTTACAWHACCTGATVGGDHMDKSDIDKLQRQALGAYLDAIERGSGVGRAKEGLAVVEGIVEAWLRERGRRERSARAPPCRCIVLRPGLDPQHWVLVLVVLHYFKVQMWALAVASVATRPNDIALLYDIAHIDKPVI